MNVRIILARSILFATRCHSARFLVFLVFCAVAQRPPSAQQPKNSSAESKTLTTEEVVSRIVGMNLRRSQALHAYDGDRFYRVEYRSSIKTVSAEMAVGVRYLAPGTKDFTIKSSSGSKLIVDKVLRKVLQAEQDAQSTEAQRRTALNSENYDFKMIGQQTETSKAMYVLKVEPKTNNKFLFRGKIWVDSDDFAVVRLEAEPAKNPSFWTKNSQIEQSYKKLNDFWLPERNHSTSSMRFGGRAELTIEYRNYQITSADPIVGTRGNEIVQSGNANRIPDHTQ
jgi:outer membrane lipoprotein-sorting protein